jgi:hypothetical protein
VDRGYTWDNRFRALAARVEQSIRVGRLAASA